MKLDRLVLNYHPKNDTILLRDIGSTPNVVMDMTDEALFCLAAWGLRGVSKPRKPNIFERLCKRIGFRVTQASNTREIDSVNGKLRITVEHLV